jgi:hypothetical protein
MANEALHDVVGDSERSSWKLPMVLRATIAAEHDEAGAADPTMLDEHRSSAWRKTSDPQSGESRSLSRSLRNSPPAHAPAGFFLGIDHSTSRITLRRFIRSSA